MSVTYSQNDQTAVAEITVSGEITEGDFDRVADTLQDFIDHHGTIGFVEVIEDLGRFDILMIPKGMAFDIRNLRHISHCAVVTDIGWLSPVARAAGAFLSTKLRIFPLAEIDEARDWVVTEVATVRSSP